MSAFLRNMFKNIHIKISCVSTYLAEMACMQLALQKNVISVFLEHISKILYIFNYFSINFNSKGTLNSPYACLSCPIGTFNDIIGLSDCQACLPGSQNTSPGSTSCTQCDLGSYSEGGAAGCHQCQEGTFGNKTGLATCFRKTFFIIYFDYSSI